MSGLARARRRAAPQSFSQADEALSETLDNLDGAENYAAWIFSLFERYLGPAVLEVGAGHGTISSLIVPRCERLLALDLSERCVKLLSSRFSDDPRVEVLRGEVASLDEHGTFDTVVLVNVLEHIEDDDAALVKLFDLLKPGGRLVLWVPAFQMLYADFDRKVGHHRRYRRNALGAQLSGVGFGLVESRYVNAFGAISWFFFARLMRGEPTSERLVRLVDRGIVPGVRWVETRLQPPFGQSVFVVAERPAGAPSNTSGP